jgi:hypothetical protein
VASRSDLTVSIFFNEETVLIASQTSNVIIAGVGVIKVTLRTVVRAEKTDVFSQVQVSVTLATSSGSTAFLSWVPPAGFITAVASDTIMFNISLIGNTVIATLRAIPTLVVGSIVVDSILTDRNSITRAGFEVLERILSAYRASHPVVERVLIIPGTFGTVVRTIVTCVISLVVIGTLMTNGFKLTELCALIVESIIVTGCA